METGVEMIEVIYRCLWKIQQIKGLGELFDIQPSMCSHCINLS